MVEQTGSPPVNPTNVTPEDLGPCTNCGATPGVARIDYYPVVEDPTSSLGIRIDRTTPFKTVVLCQRCSTEPPE